MRLLECNITGFGRIQNEHFNFSDGLNSFCEKNGWGKTTFSVFIKSMFYGMEYNPRRKELQEREHYHPWNYGTYGGSLTFEVERGTYRIERTFGRSDKDDTFALYDVKTGLESKDFTENIGEELFEMDRVSFEKSIFVPQDGLKTGMTDSMNAKLGNLASARDDINNFDAAVAKIEEARRNYNRNSSKNVGKLVRIKADIRECKEEIEKLPALSDAYEKQSALLSERHDTLLDLQKQKQRLQDRIAEQSKKEQELGAYCEQKKQMQETQEQLEKLDDFFARGIPEEEYLQEMITAERQLEVDQRELEEKTKLLPTTEEVAFLDKLFEHGVPTDEMMTGWMEDADKLKELRIKGEHAQMSDEDKDHLQELKFYFAKKNPGLDELANASADAVQLATLDGQVRELEETVQHLEAQKKAVEEASEEHSSSGAMLMFGLLTLVLVLGGVSFLRFTEGPRTVVVAAICFLAAALLMVFGILRTIRKNSLERKASGERASRLATAQVRLDETSRERDLVETKVKEFLSYFLVSPNDSTQQMIAEIQRKKDLYDRLLSEESKLIENTSGTLEELSSLQLQLYTALTGYAAVYEMDLYHDMNEVDLLQHLRNHAGTYMEYKLNKQQVEKLHQETNRTLMELREFLSGFQFDDEEDLLQNKLNTVLLNRNQYMELSKKVESLQESIRAFESEHDLSEDMETVEEVQEKQTEVDDKIAECNQFIAKEREELALLSEKLSNLEDQKSRLEGLQETEAEYVKRVDLLDKTLQYLHQAKENFLSRYMAPLQNGLRHYLLKLYNEDDAEIMVRNFSLDIDLSVSYTYKGITRQEGYLSSGYQDLVALCSRMALMDALYQKEQPMIILDDPFTNLDRDKTEMAWELMEELGQEKQIIYFTCHESRMPK